MRWAVGLGLACLASVAQADELTEPVSKIVEPGEPAETVEQPDEGDSQELGAVIGVALGGETSPGGIAIDGRYLYRLSGLDWLEMGANFSIGSSDPGCFTDRQGEFVCRHGLLDGFAAEGSVAIRRYFAGQQEFRPFARLGVGLRLVSFSGDEVRGIALPVLIGGGVRVEVADRVLIVAEGNLRAGPSFLNQDLGIAPNFALSIGAGVEFTLE